MKLSRLIVGVLMIGALLTTGASTAQAKKKAPRTKASTHSSASSPKTPAKAASITAKDLIGERYVMMMEAGQYELKIDMGEVKFEEGNKFSAKMMGTQINGTWTLSGSNIKLVAQPRGITIFSGTVNSLKRMTGTMNGQKSVFYNSTCPDNPKSVAQVKKDLIAGKYTTFLALDKGNNERSFVPATVKFTPDGADSGTYKITGTSHIFTLAGALKGEYKFVGNELIMTGVDGQERKDSIDEFTNYIIVWLGKKNLPGMGNMDLAVYFLE